MATNNQSGCTSDYVHCRWKQQDLLFPFWWMTFSLESCQLSKLFHQLNMNAFVWLKPLDLFRKTEVTPGNLCTTLGSRILWSTAASKHGKAKGSAVAHSHKRTLPPGLPPLWLETRICCFLRNNMRAFVRAVSFMAELRTGYQGALKDLMPFWRPLLSRYVPSVRSL